MYKIDNSQAFRLKGLNFVGEVFVVPNLEIDLTKLKHNTKQITNKIKELCGVVFAVTKVVGGEPEVAKTLLAGGVCGLADSRLPNIHKLRRADITCPILLLRSPALSEVKQVVQLTDISLNSEKEVLIALSRQAKLLNIQHNVILMVDLGDGREGVEPKLLPELVAFTKSLPNLSVYGIGTNLACFSDITPTVRHMDCLISLSKSVDPNFPYLSGGNSSVLHLVNSGQWGEKLSAINHWRIGESIFFGWDIINKKPLSGCYQDVCLLTAEVLEVQTKAAVDYPKAERVVLAFGLQEIGTGKVYPLDDQLKVLGASSDHLVALASQKHNIKVGDTLSFRLDYHSLLAAATSPYVNVRIRKEAVYR